MYVCCVRTAGPILGNFSGCCGPTGRKSRSIAALRTTARANAGSATLSAYVVGYIAERTYVRGVPYMDTVISF